MPLYFFHVRRRGMVIPDWEGTRVASIDEARVIAISDARALIIEHLKTDAPVPLDDGIDIADEHGAVLHTVTFKEALDSPRGAR
jgi:hypothetical protein